MRIALLGYGKMGIAVEKVGLTRGHKFPLKVRSTNASDVNAANLSACDVAIEFSTPETAFNHITCCFENGLSVVCGTTAWLDLLPEVNKLCKQYGTAFLHASNFSMGVHLFFYLNKHFAGIMNSFSDYDVVVCESHHKEKKDAPSGTAVQIAEDLVSCLDAKEKWQLQNDQQSLSSTTLMINSVRKENVVGTHKVSYQSKVDTITVAHHAHNRSGFAMGALLAAEYIYNRKGIFTMQDVLASCASALHSKQY